MINSFYSRRWWQRSKSLVEMLWPWSNTALIAMARFLTNLEVTLLVWAHWRRTLVTESLWLWEGEVREWYELLLSKRCCEVHLGLKRLLCVFTIWIVTWTYLFDEEWSDLTTLSYLCVVSVGRIDHNKGKGDSSVIVWWVWRAEHRKSKYHDKKQ